MKIGNKVYSLKNYVWGNNPMTVTEIHGDMAICDHPHRGSGGFSMNDLRLKSKMSKTMLNAREKLRKINYNYADEEVLQLRKKAGYTS